MRGWRKPGSILVSKSFLIAICGSLLPPFTVYAAEDAVGVNPHHADVVLVNASMAIPEDQRHQPHSTRPYAPKPQHPVPSTEKNVDTGRPIEEWQHLTDDWSGTRPRLDDQGIVLEASITTDWSSNLHGGTSTNGSAFRNLFLFDVTIDTERLFGHEGGTFFIDFQNHNGENGSDDVGDFQGFANIDSDGRTEVAEFWYEQILFDGQARVKVGKVEANSEFVFADNAGEFINSSMGFSPTVFVLPTYPDPSTSVVVFVYPNDDFYAGVGVFDGAGQEGITTGNRGPKTFLGNPSDLFIIGEAGMNWAAGESELPGRLGVGVWNHNGTFDRFDGGTEDGTTGFYLVFDQTLWQENPDDEDDEQGVGVYFQYGWADPDVSEAEHHVGIGIVCVGGLPGRDNDVCGIGASWVKFSDEAGAGFVDEAETVIELFYKAQILEWVSIKPDVQFIGNPGGSGLKDAVVGTVRVEFVF